MTRIRQEDLIHSISDTLQFISYYHPVDFLKAMGEAWTKEQSPAAKDAMAQILVNSRMCAEEKRPVCQDTGMVVVFLKIGMQVQWDGAMSVSEMVNEGVRHGYTNPDNVLRSSMVYDPLGSRKNSGDNTPAIIHMELVQGDKLEIKIAAKGVGSENKSRFKVLNPSGSLVDWVLEELPKMGAGWCPPGMLGIGVGGSAEKAMLLAKESLMEPIDIHEVMARGPTNRKEELRLEIFDKVNALGIGAQGLGGLTTVLDVKVSDFPTHAASLPVAMIPNCAATRHVKFTLDGSGPAVLTPPSLEDWPDVTWKPSPQARRVDLDKIRKEDIATWKQGELILLNGKLLTGRDAAHKRIADLYVRNEPLPDGIDFRGRFIYYVGPVDPVRDEVVGPAGPTTATRMDKFTELMLDQAGLFGMVGKAERDPVVLEAIKQHNAVYLMAVGGAAYLVSKAIRSSRILAFEELGMEAIREFEVIDFPVTVAVDSRGNSIYKMGPAEWRGKIAKIPVVTE
ncbi:MAG: fumarate hydratase [Candidatus Thiodiazotropha sp. (ex Lucinoma aequizonata)]|nr:fumarate hydratase [Candidatus Thiodiazotropha sp. (ex Lucinoma aequizonata)]MCU7888918.1 fumarate hydratase [Candidatus Thiodiazotropha sp. (ex Lucinoma aequizonata)]MCU7896227.1 fumarate hydratase [Candidatus Thiodiazotropha sp. (ex Lucinoma aequizonata)]MCU7900037.1 fumarate hydratase [Candidatus Thiodiazotropha sp. (ex Lucinoma aequizonata)]MCU7904135.1 fumarate hydratase [Candidatus Thiodiazotropha sp. (ex Lucinoma aequizonata)]